MICWKADDTGGLPIAQAAPNKRAAFIPIRQEGSVVALVVCGNGKAAVNARLIAHAPEMRTRLAETVSSLESGVDPLQVAQQLRGLLARIGM